MPTEPALKVHVLYGCSQRITGDACIAGGFALAGWLELWMIDFSSSCERGAVLAQYCSQTAALTVGLWLCIPLLAFVGAVGGFCLFVSFCL